MLTPSFFSSLGYQHHDYITKVLATKYISTEISSLRSRLIERGYHLPPIAERSFLLEHMGYPIPPVILMMEEMEVFLLSGKKE